MKNYPNSVIGLHSRHHKDHKDWKQEHDTNSNVLADLKIEVSLIKSHSIQIQDNFIYRII